jgi:hypothetical protein
MTEKFAEIEDFSPKEVTEMFDYLCINALQKSPIDVKKTLLGIKTAKKDTKVTLSHLMLLIEDNNLKFNFKVNYLEEEKPKTEFEKAIDKTADAAIAENAAGGATVDPLQEALTDQRKTVGERVFTEVTGGSEDKASEQPPAGGGFDPNAIPEFKP